MFFFFLFSAAIATAVAFSLIGSILLLKEPKTTPPSSPRKKKKKVPVITEAERGEVNSNRTKEIFTTYSSGAVGRAKQSTSQEFFLGLRGFFFLFGVCSASSCVFLT